MESNVYNLTNPQKSIWFTEQFYKGTPIENITGCVIVLEKLNLKALQKAINLFVKSNDSFRLKFTVKDDKPLQYLSSFSEFEIENVMVNTDEDIKDIENEMSNTPFEVLDNLLFSFKTFTFPDGHGGFVITAHHLISDAWTAGLVVNEIMDYYEKIINSQIIDNKNPSYLDYITSEQEYLNSEKFNKDKEFWNEIFKTVPEVATIPSINVENSNSSLSCKAKRKQFVIPKETMNLINEFCKQNKASAFNFFMAVLAIYLSRVSSLDDFTIGTPILNRGNFKEKQTTGMYISTIPFRISINHKISFAEFLSNISADFSKIFRHQKYPYQYLLKDLRKKDSSIPNLYNILLSYQNVRSNKQTSDINYESSWVGNNFISDDIDIHLYDMNDTGDINIAYDYLISKYSIDDICSIHARFLYIINQVLENNDITLNEIEIVTPDEKKKILYDFNNTSADYPRDKTITQLFEEQVEKTPDNIAVVFEDQKLTYRELNERANSLAYYLRDKGIGRNDIVGIMVNRSLEMIVSILGVLKSGACYIPIDPEYPQDRIEYMLNNSNAKILLTFEKLQAKVNFNNKLFVELNNSLYDSHKENLENINKPDDLAYIIYTSGSTGKPKGVMLKHSNINNFIQGMCNVVDFNSEKTIVSVTTISFDIFVLESLLPLQKGLKVVIANEIEQTDIKSFNILCVNNNVNIIQTTPSRFQVLISNPKELNYLENATDILVGGEAFPKTLLEKFNQLTKANIYNVYGPTETAVWSTVKNLTNHNIITIGTPIANTTCYILDNNKKLLPCLTPGNLFIGGTGVSAGYFNNKKLTDEKFIKNLYNSNEIIYDTGDLAYYTENGELVHLGRNDFQVKIRGYRIELEEIEKVISKFPGIGKCVVTGIDNKYLVCYYIENKTVDITKLISSLMEKLPNYMIPAHFEKIDSIPYTLNGKIDRKKLVSLNNFTTHKQITEAKTATEKAISKSIANLLNTNINLIDIDTSFLSLGLDSLSIIQLQAALVYLGYNLTTQDFYKYQTVKTLATYIDSKNVTYNEVAVYVPDSVKHISIPKQVPQLNKNSLGAVFLTGANGFIGIHVLHELLTTTTSKIYCLVRGNDLNHSIKRLIEKYQFYFNYDLYNLLNNRLFIINGDISSSNFTLSQTDINTIKENASTIIHTAAIVKHYGNPDEFISINVNGTKYIADFAYKYNKNLIHISSLSVSGNYLVRQDNTNIDFTENDLYVGQHYTENVYVNSKYLAEKVVLSYIEKGLNAKILRIGIIAGRFSDGIFQENINENAFYNRIKSMITISKVPKEMLYQHVEFTPIDYCAKAIVLLSSPTIKDNRIFHLYNHNLCTIYAIIDQLKYYNINVDVLSNEDFEKYIVELSKSGLNAHLLNGIVNDLNFDNNHSLNLNYNFSINIKSDFTQNYLKLLGFEWPKCDETYLKKLLDYMRKVNFI